MHKLGNRKEIWSDHIDENGYLAEKHGVHGCPNKTQFPSNSFELEWKEIPKAKSYAIVVEDFDAVKVIGFPFIHWIAVNINSTKLEENASYLDHVRWLKSDKKRYSKDMLWQGYNSSVPETLAQYNKEENSPLRGILPLGFTSETLENAALYFGPYPPDKDHLYTVSVIGLNVEASELKYENNGKLHTLDVPYYIGDLMQAIDKHIVGVRTLHFKYKQA